MDFYAKFIAAGRKARGPEWVEQRKEGKEWEGMKSESCGGARLDRLHRPR